MTTLDQNEPLDLATKFSRKNLRDCGEVPPAIIAATPNGIVVFNPESLSNGDDMKQFALMAQLVAIGFSARTVAIILHARRRCSMKPEILGGTLYSLHISEKPFSFAWNHLRPQNAACF